MCVLGVMVETTAPPSCCKNSASAPQIQKTASGLRDKKQQLWRVSGPRGPCGDTRGTSLLRKLKFRESIVFTDQIVNMITLSKIQFIH